MRENVIFVTFRNVVYHENGKARVAADLSLMEV